MLVIPVKDLRDLFTVYSLSGRENTGCLGANQRNRGGAAPPQLVEMEPKVKGVVQVHAADVCHTCSSDQVISSVSCLTELGTTVQGSWPSLRGSPEVQSSARTPGKGTDLPRTPVVDSSAPHCLPPSSPAEAQAPPLPGILGWKMWLHNPSHPPSL